MGSRLRTIQKIALCTSLLLVASIPVVAQTKLLSKLKSVGILKTSRFELEKIFGRPKIEFSDGKTTATHIEYKLREGILTVFYSPGRCAVNATADYDVEANIVTELSFTFDIPLDLSKFDLDLNGFTRSQIEDLEGVGEYRNLDTGEYYQIGEFDEKGIRNLRKVQLFPSAAADRFKCKSD